MHGFHAKYAGRCRACWGNIEIGDAVAFDDDELVHVDCHTGAPRPARAIAARVCSRCRQELSVTGVCDNH